MGYQPFRKTLCRLLLVVFTATAPVLSASDLIDGFDPRNLQKPDDADPAHPPVLLNSFEAFLFDRRLQLPRSWIDRCNAIAGQRIGELAELYGATDSQRKKLELAARRDMLKLGERIRGERTRFATQAKLPLSPADTLLWQRALDSIRFEIRHGPFGDDSYLNKMEHTIFTNEQVSRATETLNRLMTSKVVITPENISRLRRASRRNLKADSVAWDRQGERLWILADESGVDAYSADGQRHLFRVGSEFSPVGFDINPDGRSLAMVNRAGQVRVQDVTTNESVTIENTASDPAIRFHPDGTRLATTSGDQQVTLWSVATRERLAIFETGEMPPGTAPDFSVDGSLMAVAVRQSRVFIFDSENQKLVQFLEWKPSTSFQFDPSRRQLAIGYTGGNINLYNPLTAARLVTVKSDFDQLTLVSWSPDGSLLATAGDAGKVMFWEAPQLREIHQCEAPEQVVAVRFHPAGTHFLCAARSRFGTISEIAIWAVLE